MIEEQNQEKATATRHVTMVDTAAPETRNGKKEDKGGGKKEKKTAKPLTPKQLQQRKRLTVCPLMGLLFLGPMWLTFAPSEKRKVGRDTVGVFNADILLPENDGIIGDKRKAYEQAQAERRQVEKVHSLEDLAFSEENDANEVEMGLPDSGPERKPSRGYSGNGGGRSSIAACRDINRKFGSLYEGPKVGGEKEELKRQVEELTAELEERERQAGGIDDQVTPMEKSCEFAAKYMGQSGQNGAIVQTPATGQGGSGLEQPAVVVQTAQERTVSGLRQPLNDAEFTWRYSQPRSYDFNTAVGSGYTLGKNTIAACIHQDQTTMDGQQMRLRLLEPLQAGNLTIPRNAVVSGTDKMQGERLNITVSSVQRQGNISPVELTVYDDEGMKGLCIETSLGREVAGGAMANIDSGLGTSISFARNAGQQVAMGITRGLMRGSNQYLAKEFRAIKVRLKAGDPLMLYAKRL